MYGWTGKLLRVNLTKTKTLVQKYTFDIAKNFLGGRGFAIKILWDELKPAIDPLSPENKLILATGPLTGFTLPSSGKLVVAAKSPLTGGYGDGNIGTYAAVQIRKAGYDAIVVEGKAKKPVFLLIQDEQTHFVDAKDLWGLNSFETERKLRDAYGSAAGVLCIGQGGENLVKFANVVCQEGRAGGRPGIGAVMGSKNLKAIVIVGSGNLSARDPKKLKELGAEAYREILARSNYAFWRRQGTMANIEWSQENSVLPSYNFKEGTFEEVNLIDGFAMERIKVSQRGCPYCNAICGNVVEDADERLSELDYENVAMLGSNIGLGDLKKIASLNRMADEFGIDTISLGNVIGFAMEASEKGLITEKISWGDYNAAKTLIEDIAYRRGLGNTLAEGVRFVAEKIGGDSNRWAMHVKGLEISAYDCHASPAMALAYATSSIGAHHKDAFVISLDIRMGRESYSEEKVDKLIELQRLRGGLFECLTTCKIPWAVFNLELEWYLKFLNATTCMEFSFEDLYIISDRVLNLIRAFWIRELGGKWSKAMDFPPVRWFEEPLSKGPLKGTKLDRTKYDHMLQVYYRKRGWDKHGIPTKSTLIKLGLPQVVNELYSS